MKEVQFSARCYSLYSKLFCVVNLCFCCQFTLKHFDEVNKVSILGNCAPLLLHWFSSYRGEHRGENVPDTEGKFSREGNHVRMNLHIHMCRIRGGVGCKTSFK